MKMRVKPLILTHYWILKSSAEYGHMATSLRMTKRRYNTVTDETVKMVDIKTFPFPLSRLSGI